MKVWTIVVLVTAVVAVSGRQHHHQHHPTSPKIIPNHHTALVARQDSLALRKVHQLMASAQGLEEEGRTFRALKDFVKGLVASKPKRKSDEPRNAIRLTEEEGAELAERVRALVEMEVTIENALASAYNMAAQVQKAGAAATALAAAGYTHAEQVGAVMKRQVEFVLGNTIKFVRSEKNQRIAIKTAKTLSVAAVMIINIALPMAIPFEVALAAGVGTLWVVADLSHKWAWSTDEKPIDKAKLAKVLFVQVLKNGVLACFAFPVEELAASLELAAEVGEGAAGRLKDVLSTAPGALDWMCSVIVDMFGDGGAVTTRCSTLTQFGQTIHSEADQAAAAEYIPTSLTEEADSAEVPPE